MQLIDRKVLWGFGFLILFTFMRGACTVAEWGDVSLDESGSGIVGGIYEANMDMGIFGITLGSEKKLDYYSIIRLPGIAGRGVLTKGIIPKGTKIRVLRVQKCTSCWPFDWSRFVVRVLTEPGYNESLVVIDKSRVNVGNSPFWSLVAE